jgi:ubiquinone/menaquinone biosynthesis C-methylase UbiE
LSRFEKLAETWDADPAKRRRARVWARAVRKHIPEGGNAIAMEYGCGTGLLSCHLHTELKRIIMVDSSQGMLDILKAKIQAHDIPNMAPRRMDLTRDPLPEMKLDLLYTAMTLHHIRDIDAILKAFFSLLKEGGRLCIIDLDAEDGSFHGLSFDGHRGFHRQNLKARLRLVGFCRIRDRSVYSITKMNAGGIQKRFPLFLMTARKPEPGGRS